jgi:acyl carrier protein
VDEEEQPLKSALVEVTSTYEEKGIEKTSLLKPVMKKSDIDDVQKREQLRAIVSGYTGIPICDIRNDESFNSLGLDSLSAMALSDDLKETFNIDLSADFLFTSDVNALYKLLLAPDKDSSIAVDSAPELATPMSSTDEENKGEIYNQDSRFSNLGTDRNINNEIGGMKNRRGSCRHKVQTIIYKEVDGTRIPADVFIPLEPPSQAMPIGT